MSEAELLTYVESKLGTLYDNQEKQIEAINKVHELLSSYIEKQDEIKESEETVEQTEVQAVVEEEETSTFDEYLADSREFQEQQIELLTEVRDHVETSSQLEMLSASFLGILIGVLMASIFAKYIKH